MSSSMLNCTLNPSSTELGYVLPLQTVMKPTDLDLHYLPFSMWICINNLDQVIRLAETKSGRGILIYSSLQGLKFNSVSNVSIFAQTMM